MSSHGSHDGLDPVQGFHDCRLQREDVFYGIFFRTEILGVWTDEGDGVVTEGSGWTGTSTLSRPSHKFEEEERSVRPR